MKRSLLFAHCVGIVFAAIAPGSVQAQSADASGRSRLAFTLGTGISAVPGYFGSDEAAPGFELNVSSVYQSFGPLSFGNPDPDAVADEGFGFRGAFRYLPGRTADDYEELAGLEMLALVRSC